MGELKIIVTKEDEIGGNGWYVDMTNGVTAIQLGHGDTPEQARQKARETLKVLEREL